MPGLVIRREQMRVLQEDILCRWICSYLRNAYGPQAERLVSGNLIQLVKGAVQEAKRFKLEDPADLRKYAHVVFLVGCNVEENFPWARKILTNPDYKFSGVRLSALEDAAIEYLRKTAAQEGRT
jgi:hypothetical protein